MSKRERVRETRRQGDPSFPSFASQKSSVTRPSAPPPPPPTQSSGPQGREVNGQGVGKGHKGRHRKKGSKGLKVTFNLDVEKVKKEEPVKEVVVECWEELSDGESNQSGLVITQDDMIDCEKDFGIISGDLLVSEDLKEPGNEAASVEPPDFIAVQFGSPADTELSVPQNQADLPEGGVTIPDDKVEENMIRDEYNPVIEMKESVVQEIIIAKEDSPTIDIKEESVSSDDRGGSALDVSVSGADDHDLLSPNDEAGVAVPQISWETVDSASSHFVELVEDTEDTGNDGNVVGGENEMDDRSPLEDEHAPVLQSLGGATVTCTSPSVDNESDTQTREHEDNICGEDKEEFTYLHEAESPTILEANRGVIASSTISSVEVKEYFNVECQDEEGDDDDWETEPSGGSSEDSNTGNKVNIDEHKAPPPTEEEVWLTGANICSEEANTHQQDFDEGDDLLIKGDIEAVLMALMEDQEKISPTPPSLVTSSAEWGVQATVLHQEDQSPPPLVAYPTERSPSLVAYPTERSPSLVAYPTERSPSLVAYPRERSPQVSIGFECRDRNFASVYVSETESEGELVSCDDKCVGTADYTSESDDETQDLTISENLTVSEALETLQTAVDEDQAGVVRVTPSKEEVGATPEPNTLEVPGVKQGDLTPSPDLLTEGKAIGNSECVKEKEKVNGKKTGKKKGKKNKRDAKTEQAVSPPPVPGRPRLVRGRAWKEKTEKFRAEYGNPLDLSFGNELCESEVVEATSNLLTETYTEATLLTPTRCPSGTTVFTETPCTACSSVSGEFSESECLHGDCVCGEKRVSDAGVVALVTEVKPCDGTHYGHRLPDTARGLVVVVTADTPDYSTHSQDTTTVITETITYDATHDPTTPTLESVTHTHDPVISSLDPVISSHDPVISSHDLVISSHDLVISSHDPAISSVDPVISSHNPVISSHDLVMSSHDPVISTHDPVIFYYDHITHTDTHYGLITSTHALDSSTDDPASTSHAPSTTNTLPRVTVELTVVDEDDEDRPSPVAAENDDFFIVRTQTVEAPLQVLTEYVVDSEDSSSLSQPEEDDHREDNFIPFTSVDTQPILMEMTEDIKKNTERSVPNSWFGDSVTDNTLPTYSDATSSSCRETLGDSYDYEQSFPSLVGTHKLLVYSYDTDSDSESASGRISYTTSQGPSELGSSGVVVVNVGDMSDDDHILPSGVGDIVYEGPCMCGSDEAERRERRDVGTRQVGMGSDEQLCVPPLLGDSEVLAPNEAKAKSDKSVVCDHQKAGVLGTMDIPVEETSSECDAIGKDIRSRINEIVGLRLQREPGQTGTNVTDVGGHIGHQEYHHHHLGREDCQDSPLPGSSPASSSGVQGSDEMSLSRSRSRSPSCEEFAATNPVSDLPEETYPVQTVAFPDQTTPGKYEREALESLRALRFEGSVESTPEKVNQVDCSFRTFRDMYQINPIYLTDSEDHGDQNESDTEVPRYAGLISRHDPDAPITVSSWATDDDPPVPLDARTPKPHATRKIPKVTRQLRETKGIVQRWEVLQAQAVERQRHSGQIRELQRQVKSLRQALEALTVRANDLTQAVDVDIQEQLSKKLEDAKALQQEVTARKVEVSGINLAVHRFLTETGYSLAPVKDDVADLYRIWDEADRRVNSEVTRLESVQATWKLWESQAEELSRALRQDSDTLRVLDAAIQTGGPLTDSVTASVEGVARLLNHRRKTLPGGKKILLLQHTKTQGVDIQGSTQSLVCGSGDECLSDSGTSGYESCSSEELSERERRLAHLRRLARDLEASLHPDSHAWAAVCKTLSSAETELKGLQKHCRELVVRTAGTLDQAKTSPQQLRRRIWSKDNKVGRVGRRGNTASGRDSSGRGSGRKGWMWRVVRAALPFQAALLLLFCVACLLEPNCCDHVNNLNLSLSPQLRYVHGPPPV